VALATIARANLLHPKDFVRIYRNHLSDFLTWKEKDHADTWLVFPENLGDHLSIDEVEVSGGELYTVLTNKERHSKQGCLVAIVQGTKVDIVTEAINRIPLVQRKSVQTITRDLAETMTDIATICFPNAQQIDDRFHVQQLVSDTLQEVRVALRKEAIKEDNIKVAEARAKGKYHKPRRYENGDTLKELLARGRYVLYKSSGRWTKSQKERADILFQEYPQLQDAYELSMQFRGIYEHAKSPDDGKQRLQRWYESVTERLEAFPNFETPMQTIQLHEETIVNYFHDRRTNASAESFNAKIKNFRALQRGVRDVKFFLYRLSKLYG
jgi:transposase